MAVYKWCITLPDFQMLGQSCVPRMDSVESWCILLSIYYWIQFLWGILVWGFLFLWCLWTRLSIKSKITLIIWVGKRYSAVFWKNLCRIGNYFLTFDRVYQRSPLGLGFSLWEDFKITYSISLLGVGLSGFFFIFWVSFGNFILLGICPFLIFLFELVSTPQNCILKQESANFFLCKGLAGRLCGLCGPC